MGNGLQRVSIGPISEIDLNTAGGGVRIDYHDIWDAKDTGKDCPSNVQGYPRGVYLPAGILFMDAEEVLNRKVLESWQGAQLKVTINERNTIVKADILPVGAAVPVTILRRDPNRNQPT